MTKQKKWKLHGELAMSCSCDVFCPCVISLGAHPPTEGNCKAWAGVRIDDGFYGDVDLSGVVLAIFLEIPGKMERGGWSAALFINQGTDIYAEKALIKIFTGKAGGSTALLDILVSDVLGVKREKIEYSRDGDTRIIKIPKIIDGALTPIAGDDPDKNVTIRNSSYWIAPKIIVARSDKSRFREFGRNWNFTGKSAEICKLRWSGP
jgi:hypothetical protein